MKKIPRNIALEIKKRILPQGYEIQKEDVGVLLEFSWGTVCEADIGKRCFVTYHGFAIENSSQRDKRKGFIK